MTYFPMGDVASTDFNSTKYPGVCKPSTTDALATFRRMQTQLDRVATVKGLPLIAVDGDIGPGTIGLFSKLKQEIVSYAMANQDVAASTKIALATSCAQVASVADVIANEAESYADSLNAPSKPASPPPAKPPTLVLQTGQEVPAPMSADILEAFKNIGTTGMLAIGAAMLGIGFLLLAKPGKAAPAKSSVRYRTRTRTRYIPRYRRRR
jgi:hypothetical protein